MALVDALLDKITDDSLRKALREQVDQLLSKQSYGLVFQQHKPETVELPNYTVRRNCKVRVKSEGDDELYLVDNVKKNKATIRSLVDEPEFWDIDVSDLVVVREFGDPIYPGLVSTGKVENGRGKPPQLVINAENFHALEVLLYTHEGKFDAIYIDPPYNTRDKDWKYNNDYVDASDVYRHSKWLAMMERRLKLAERLLRPDNSVLIVTIDEKEYLRLGLLLEQTFKAARITMVTSSINSAGATRRGTFNRAAEYIYFVHLGESRPAALELSDEWNAVKTKNKQDIYWSRLIRSGADSARSDSANQFYPVYIRNAADGPQFVGVGDAYFGNDRSAVNAPDGAVVVWPIRRDGSEGRWRVGAGVLRDLLSTGHARLGPWRDEKTTLYYLKQGERQKVTSGVFKVIGHRADGSVMTDASEYEPQFVPTDVWRVTSHDAGNSGSRLLDKFLPGRDFPFPKSLYAVEDALKFYLVDKPDALVLDFFAGSGTTAHAVMRLNKDDDGRRQCVLVTNNEVSAEEQDELRADGLSAGDPEWEQLGICEHITKPRIIAAITGKTPEGQKITGEYKFNDEYPMSDGFEENAEFFNLTYEDPDLVSLGRSFEALAPLLWLKAGGCGTRIEAPEPTWGLPLGAVYGVLFDTNSWREFVDVVTSRLDEVRHVFISTESEAVFQQIVTELPASIEPTQLYEDYLQTFEINTKGRA